MMEPRQVGISGPLDARIPSFSPAQGLNRKTGTGDFRKLVQANQIDSFSGNLTSSEITFSAHARERLKMRNINLNDDDMKNISNAIDRVSEKGGRQALLFVKTSSGEDTAMVVNAKNRIVITAMDMQSMRDNVFTNIDSAAIVN